jgi:hypothetical protein
MTSPTMRHWAGNIALLAITLWVGCLWGVGFLAVPVLFQALPDKMLAGMLAGKMFTLVAYVGIISASCLLAYSVAESGKQALRQTFFWTAAIMLLLTLLGEFYFQPEMSALKAQALPGDVMHSAFADRFKMLHGFAGSIYLLQSLLGVVLVLKAKRC